MTKSMTSRTMRALRRFKLLIDEMIAKGNLVIMNHPTWSRNKQEDLLQLQRYFAVEIYNHQSELDEAVGYGVRHWDYLLRHGRKVFAVAGDDAHGGPIDSAISEFFGGWIAVQAEELQQESIISTMKRKAAFIPRTVLRSMICASRTACSRSNARLSNS